MPDERDIEKGLRAWARRRREEAGAPVELHPATRRLLQAEAARLRGGQKRGSVARWLWGSPLRLVLSLSAVAALVVAAALLLPQLRHSPAAISAGPAVLAENNHDQNENPMNGTMVEPVETGQNSRDVSKTKSNGNIIVQGDNLSLYKKDTTPPSAVPGAAPPTPTFDQEMLAKNSPAPETAARAVAPAPPAATDKEAVPPAPAVQGLMWVNSPTNGPASDYRAAKRPPAGPLLGSFRTEQTGNRLRVIDADGSVYTGVLAAARGQALNDGVSAVQTRSFRVSGTNVTIHQRVVFAGHLVLGLQPQPTASSTVAGGELDVNGTTAGGGGGGFGGAHYYAGNRQTNAPAVAGTALQASVTSGALPAQPQFRLEGTVRIGTNQIPVNAVPATP
jgi:hypothetical protein